LFLQNAIANSLFVPRRGTSHFGSISQADTPETFICRPNSRTFFGMPVRPVATFLAQHAIPLAYDSITRI
jgi:hypothetical protein